MKGNEWSLTISFTMCIDLGDAGVDPAALGPSEGSSHKNNSNL